MSAAMLLILGFQLWWLKDSYKRERHSLEMKANIQFQETVHGLQEEKFRIIPDQSDSGQKDKVRIFINEETADGDVREKMIKSHNVVTTVNMLGSKISDSVKGENKRQEMIFVTRRNGPTPDSLKRRTPANIAFKYLYGIDSLQDSLKLPDISNNYRKALLQQNMNVPFSILKLDSAEEGSMADVTVGFVHPVTYRLVLGNIFPAVLKRLTIPVIFSVFLVALTIFSFLILYKNILRQQRLGEMKNDLISNITHELKTPLATVGVAIEAMKSFSVLHDGKKTREYLDISSSELQRLNLLVDKVLKLSMFEKKQVDLKYEQVDLREVVDEVVNSMRLQIEEAGAKVTVYAAGNPVLTADRLHLLSVIFNLLDNALKYTDGDPEIKISLQENADTISMNVTDNGIGIPAEYCDKVFEKFFRIPTGNTHNAKGYGLGLSYVAHVIERHHGSISVTNTNAMGCTFSIILPKHPA
jgi:two-component system, OmpR family, phosphate regulon sensor histidine kinase PhoR